MPITVGEKTEIQSVQSGNNPSKVMTRWYSVAVYSHTILEKCITSFLPLQVRGDCRLQEIKLIFLWENWGLFKLSLLVKPGHKAKIEASSYRLRLPQCFRLFLWLLSNLVSLKNINNLFCLLRKCCAWGSDIKLHTTKRNFYLFWDLGILTEDNEKIHDFDYCTVGDWPDIWHSSFWSTLSEKHRFVFFS